MLKIYTVYDSKAECYLQPFYCKSKGDALRSFAEIANDKQAQIGKYPEDFTLFELGSWDESTCLFSIHKGSIALGCAIEFVKGDSPVMKQLQAVS